MKAIESLLVLIVALYTSGAWATDAIGEPGRESGKANPLKNVYFGEQRINTSASPDAFALVREAPGTMCTTMRRAKR